MATPEAWLLGESKGFWINTAVLIVSVWVTAFAVYLNTKLAKKRATLDILLARREDRELVDAIHFMYSWENRGLDPKLALQAGSDFSEKAKIAMNYHEFVALSVLEGALDEGMYKRMQYNNFLKFWSCAKPVVAVIREATGKDTFFQDMEWLARRWHAEPLERTSDHHIR